MTMIGHNKKSRDINSLSSIEKDKLKGAVKELVDSKTRVAAENDLQKEIIANVSEALGIEKKLVRKLAKTSFNSSFETEVEDQREFEDFWSMLMGASS